MTSPALEPLELRDGRVVAISVVVVAALAVVAWVERASPLVQRIAGSTASVLIIHPPSVRKMAEELRESLLAGRSESLSPRYGRDCK